MKMLYLKDDAGDEVAIDIKKVTHLQKVAAGNVVKNPPDRCYVNFTGGTFITVQGTVGDVGMAIRMHRS